MAKTYSHDAGARWKLYCATMKKAISLLLSVVLAMSVFSIAVNAVDDIATGSMVDESVEQKVYCNATIEDDFTGDRIMVVMSSEDSLEFNDYDATDFSEIGCRSVHDLSQVTKERVKQKVETIKAAAVDRNTEIEPYDASGIDTYNQVICLELKNPGKENVLDAIAELQKRDDVLYAGPDYVISVSATTASTSSDEYLSDQVGAGCDQIARCMGYYYRIIQRKSRNTRYRN